MRNHKEKQWNWQLSGQILSISDCLLLSDYSQQVKYFLCVFVCVSVVCVCCIDVQTVREYDINIFILRTIYVYTIYVCVCVCIFMCIYNLLLTSILRCVYFYLPGILNIHFRHLTQTLLKCIFKVFVVVNIRYFHTCSMIFLF